MKVLVYSSILLVLYLQTLSEARQGCCSHHGGVCGCGCCDGTPLSAKCAPYYDCGESRTRSSSSICTKQEMMQLQKDLKTLGYYDGAIDGVPGKMTKEAIQSFQHENGLEVTGAADTQTIRAIRNAAE